jgi:hypothetical protein
MRIPVAHCRSVRSLSRAKGAQGGEKGARPPLPRTMKPAQSSLTVQGGGKRRSDVQFFGRASTLTCSSQSQYDPAAPIMIAAIIIQRGQIGSMK